jgi:hypothetical protein
MDGSWKEVGLDSQADQILTAIRKKNQQMCFFHSETRKDCSNQRKWKCLAVTFIQTRTHILYIDLITYIYKNKHDKKTMSYTCKERKVSSLALPVTLSSIGAGPEGDVIKKKCSMTTNLEFLFD